MSILDVTEDQIFHTLGRGRDPNFKPIEKVRPIIQTPKKSYTINKLKPAITLTQPVQVPAATSAPSPQFEDSMTKFNNDIIELNNRVSSLQRTVKWYIVPQFVVVVVVLLALVLKS